MKLISVRFSAKYDLEIPVQLMTVPALTTAQATTPFYGRWVCMSPYIGKKTVGLFYVKRVPEPACDRDQYWVGVCDLARNPYAFFLDTPDEKQARLEDPFMFWDHFYLDIGTSSTGKGKLLTREYVPGSGFIFDWNQTV